MTAPSVREAVEILRAEMKCPVTTQEYKRLLNIVLQAAAERDALKAENANNKFMRETYFADTERLREENAALRGALSKISRMKTLPNHASNTFTLAIAHQLAEEALQQTGEKNG